MILSSQALDQRLKHTCMSQPPLARTIVRRLLLSILAAVCLLQSSAPAQEANAIQKGAQLTILQINDVYETSPVGGLGGLARVATVKQNVARSGATPLLVIAGDFLSSSVASSIFKGKQMIEAFNAMALDLATLGNHEFDFGKDVLLARMAESRFQYVVANVFDTATGRPIGGAAPHLVKTFGTLKVGFFGLCLVSEEISGDKRRGLQFLDPMTAAERAIAALHREQADAIVAITHLSYEEDRRLARRFPEISVIVGGHEHFPITSMVDRTLISKAGSDAKWVARIDLRRDADGLERHISMVTVDGTLAEDATTATVVAAYEARLGKELDVVVGTSGVALDGESRSVRSGETNLGNLVADAIRAAAGADVAIVNSGSIRGDRVYPAGPLSRRTLLAMQPFGNVICTLVAPGRVVLQALNTGTAQWPAAAGRFPQVSGLTFALDAKRAEGDRVTNVRVGREPLATDRPYTIAIPDYLLTGGDGYDMFAGQRVATGPEAGEIIVAALERYVTARRDIAPQVEGRITIVR
jgi:5'-nucleotidase